MRIISGTKKGMELASPHGHKTHPMSEKLRGAIYNALGDVEGLTILDPFCGTAALGLEGMSRGAKSAVCIDVSTQAYDSAKENIEKSGFSNCKLIRMNASVWSEQNITLKFDLIFFDPPFDDVKMLLLDKLAINHTKSGSIVVCNLPTGFKPEFTCNFNMLQTNPHGDATLWFFKRD